MAASLPVLDSAAPAATAKPGQVPPAHPPSPPSPGHPEYHVFTGGGSRHVLVVDGSRIYEIDDEAARALSAAARAQDRSRGHQTLLTLGLLHGPPFIQPEPPRSFPLRSLSLAVAQKCNLGCSYCYAQEGSFGDSPLAMSREVALAAVDRLFASAAPGEGVHLAFLGGEPLMNRAVLREATEEAVRRARTTGVRLGLAVTTNGTLLTPEDGDFFEEHSFAVTVSVDGVGDSHDAQRPFKSGRGSYAVLLRRVRPLLRRQRRMQVSARVTVTPANLHLRETLDGLIAEGFHSVGFSPLLSAPSGRLEMAAGDLQTLLDEMKACGRELERRLLNQERYPFANLMRALEEIHRGTHRPYPCGAGAGYFGVDARGGLSACHRFVNDDAGVMGDVWHGVEAARQQDWLKRRHVHLQEPCSSCWARYLCGGGCHHEVIHRGRPACDFIRGWLDYCLGAYARLVDQVPEMFPDAPTPAAPAPDSRP